MLFRSFFTKWLVEHEWGFFEGWREAFTASDFATGLLSDLVVVTLMMIALPLWDRKRLGPKWTVAVIASLGPSASMSLACSSARAAMEVVGELVVVAASFDYR